MSAWWIWYDFQNIVFKIKDILCILSRSAPPKEKFGMHLWSKSGSCNVPLCGTLWQYRTQTYSVEWRTLFLSQYTYELFRGKSFPILIYKVLLHDVVIGVWCAVSVTSIIGPTHFLSRTEMLHTFWSHVLNTYSIMM